MMMGKTSRHTQAHNNKPNQRVYITYRSCCGRTTSIAFCPMEASPVAAIGDIVDIRWASSEHQEEMFATTVTAIEKSSKVKQGSRFTYFLQFPCGDIRKTRLLHREFSVREAVKESKKRKRNNHKLDETKSTDLIIPPHRFILAPMVGGSELAFRMLCRNYGISIAYTPMMNSELFAVDPAYRAVEFQTNELDRPLVAHFSGNNPDIMLAAARHVEDKCDAIDLNLGCPQRIAHSGHFGSYLLGEEDRETVLAIVRKLSTNLSIPVFVKIRLLDTVDETLRLCTQLAEAGASLIAIHARYRVNLVGRSGPGARDGPAHLDQVKYIRERMPPSLPIIANGNIITYEDAVSNLELTGANGVMSAEGILDNPALFSPAHCKIKLKTEIALEYLEMVDKYGPVKMKSVIFHVRRICKIPFEKYQLLEDCMACTDGGDINSVRAVVQQAYEYESGSKHFVFDPQKQKRAKEAAARKKAEEGKRKAFEERMVRKAKREGKSDLMFYLNSGAENPSVEQLEVLRGMTKEQAFEVWKSKYSQHCFAFHFQEGGCPRDRKCAFLHADARIGEAVAYG